MFVCDRLTSVGVVCSAMDAAHLLTDSRRLAFDEIAIVFTATVANVLHSDHS